MTQKEHSTTMTVASASTKGVNKAVTQGGRLAPQPMAPEAAKALAIKKALSKAELTRVTEALLPKSIPDFDTPGATKDGLIAEWLTAWITEGLNSGALNEMHLLPRKADLATYLGVSVGTVQNAIRYVEDEGHVESKQRIGTVIRHADSNESRLRKQTSKRDQAVVAIRHFVANSGLQPGQPMPSAREVAKLIGSAPNTTRLALEFLAAEGTLRSQGVRGNKANWYVETIPTIDPTQQVALIESETLIDQLERDLKTMIMNEYEVGQKLPSHLDLGERFHVSIKTIHDAMRRLGQQEFVNSKRGRYGTYVARIPESVVTSAQEALFVPVDQQSAAQAATSSAFYNYQRVEAHLKALIASEFKPKDKLPAMSDLADRLNVSTNTVRKALQNLGKEGFVSFTRGRYGGTFVTKLPRMSQPQREEALKWISKAK